MRKIARLLLGLSASVVLTISSCTDSSDLRRAPFPEEVKIFPDRLSDGAMDMVAGHGYLAAHYQKEGQAADSSRWVLMDQQGEVLWTKDLPVPSTSTSQIDQQGHIHIISGKGLLVLDPSGAIIRQEATFFDKLPSAPFILSTEGDYILWGGISSFNQYGVIERWSADGQQIFRTVLKANTSISSAVVDGLGDILVWGSTTRDVQTCFLLKLTRDGKELWYRHHDDPGWIDTGQSNYNWVYTRDLYATSHGSLYGIMQSNGVWLFEFDFEGRMLDSCLIEYPHSYHYVASSSPNFNGDITLYLGTDEGFHNGFFGRHFGVHLRKGLETVWTKDLQGESRDSYAACCLIEGDRVALWGKIATTGPFYQPILIITDPNE